VWVPTWFVRGATWGKAKARSSAREVRARESDVDVVWHAFELDPGAPARARCLGAARRAHCQEVRHLGRACARHASALDRRWPLAEGLPFDFEHIRSGKHLRCASLDRARAREHGLQDQVKERFHGARTFAKAKPSARQATLQASRDRSWLTGRRPSAICSPVIITRARRAPTKRNAQTPRHQRRAVLRARQPLRHLGAPSPRSCCSKRSSKPGGERPNGTCLTPAAAQPRTAPSVAPTAVTEVRELQREKSSTMMRSKVARTSFAAG